MRRDGDELPRDKSELVETDGQFDTVLAAARANAGWAYERLFYAFAPRVSGFLRAQGSAEPDELTNDVFMSAFRSLNRFEGDETAFRAWLFTITRNRLVDERRRLARGGAVVPDDMTTHHDETGGDVEAEAMVNIDNEWLRGLFAQLPPGQREVLLLRIIGDLTIDQIARVIGKRSGAVKALQRRGLASVKRLLDAERVPLKRSNDV